MKGNRKNDWGLTVAIIFAIIGILGIFFPYSILNNLQLGKYVLHTLPYNELGDFIGGITSPFLALSAFILLFLTYRTQRTELQESRTILEKQNETLKKQQFETTFFNMLNLHHVIVNNMDIIKIRKTDSILIHDEKRTTVKGRDCFVIFYQGLENFYSSTKKKSVKEIDKVHEAYQKYYKVHQSDLGHYFRNLYHIFKFIDQSEIEIKGRYTSLVRAQLSSHELLLLFYNCLSNYGQKFKPLIEKYHLLKNMPRIDLLNESHIDFYNVTAYIKNE